MKRILVALLLIAGAFIAYRQISASAVSRTFGRFAEAWARGRTDDAMALAEGPAVRKSLERHPFVNVIKPPWTVDAFHGFETSVVRRSKSEVGDLEIEARQLIEFDPPGATSALGGAAVATFHHLATLRKTSDGWRVLTFSPECESVVLRRDRHR